MSGNATALPAPFHTATLAACALPLVALGVGLALGGYAPTARDAATAAAGEVEPGRAHAWLGELQRRFPARKAGTPNHLGSIAFIASAMAEAGIRDVQRQAIGLAKAKFNVLGRVPGRDRSRAVVLAAHHDVVPGAPGAIDDGGAIACILEAARVIRASGQEPACDLLIVSYDGEEYGLLGSKHHVDELGEAGLATIHAAVAVELVGWKEDQLVVHTIPNGFAWEADGIAPSWIAEAIRGGGRLAGVEVGLGDPYVSPWYQATIRVLGVRTGSDAGAFSEVGIPAAMLTGSALTNFYAGYHRESDTMERVDPARLDDAARVLAATALELAALPPERATRALGDAYLAIGQRTLRRGVLTVIGLLGALPLLLVGLGLRRATGQTGLVAVLVFTAAGSLALLALLGSVLGLVVGVPLALGLGLAVCLPRGRLPLLILGHVPLVIEGLLLLAAGMMFGFRWRGGSFETALVVVLILAVFSASGRLAPDEGEADGAQG